MPKEPEVAWLDGELVPAADASVPLLTHTLHYGLGIFEGIRSYETADGKAAIFRLQDHMKRLVDSAKICSLDLPYGVDELCNTAVDLVRRNGFRSCYIRPLVFLGVGSKGLGATDNPVRTAMATWEWGAYLGEDGLKRGIRAKISSFSRGHVNSSMAKGKIVGQYVNSIFAKWEAKRLGFDEAILLDTTGYVSEASGENVFAITGKTLWTPPATGTILEGITRDTIIELARERGYQVREERFTRDFLWTADEAFLTGTAAEVTPVREIDHRPIGEGTAGKITLELQEAYFDAVHGKDAKHREWLTEIPS